MPCHGPKLVLRHPQAESEAGSCGRRRLNERPAHSFSPNSATPSAAPVSNDAPAEAGLTSRPGRPGRAGCRKIACCHLCRNAHPRRPEHRRASLKNMVHSESSIPGLSYLMGPLRWLSLCWIWKGAMAAGPGDAAHVDFPARPGWGQCSPQTERSAPLLARVVNPPYERNSRVWIWNMWKRFPQDYPC